MFNLFPDLSGITTPTKKRPITIGDMILARDTAMDTGIYGRCFGSAGLYDPLFRAGDGAESPPAKNMTKSEQAFLAATVPLPGHLKMRPKQIDRRTNRIPSSEDGEYITITETWTSFSTALQHRDYR